MSVSMRMTVVGVRAFAYRLKASPVAQMIRPTLIMQ